MNRSRREQLNSALQLLSRAESTISQVCDEEQDSLNSMPENLQSGDRYTAMENAVDCLSDAIDSVQEAAEYVQSAIDL